MAAHDPELDRLLERAQRGDSDAWIALVSLLKDTVYSVPRRYRLGSDDAADVFMATFQALHGNLDRIESGRALPRWLAVVAARESLRIRRLRDRTVNDVPLEEIVAHEDESAEVEAIRVDDAFRVQRALYGEDDASYASVAERLKVPMGTIGPNRARCLEKLRKIMEDEGFFG